MGVGEWAFFFFSLRDFVHYPLWIFALTIEITTVLWRRRRRRQCGFCASYFTAMVYWQSYDLVHITSFTPPKFVCCFTLHSQCKWLKGASGITTLLKAESCFLVVTASSVMCRLPLSPTLWDFRAVPVQALLGWWFGVVASPFFLMQHHAFWWWQCLVWCPDSLPNHLGLKSHASASTSWVRTWCSGITTLLNAESCFLVVTVSSVMSGLPLSPTFWDFELCQCEHFLCDDFEVR